jgi:diguanylate cyclase (GGDEF)-like protein
MQADDGVMTLRSLLGRNSIRTQLTAIILGATMLVAAVGLAVELSLDYRDYRSRALETSRDLFHVLSRDFASVMRAESPTAAADTAARIQGFADVLEVVLFDNDRRTVFRYLEDGSEVLAPPTFAPAEPRFVGLALEQWQPVRHEGAALGTVFIRVSLERVYGDLKEKVGRLLLAIPAMFLLAVWLAFRAQRQFTAPVVRLYEAVKRVSATQDYTVRVQRKDDNEIGLLFDGFNEMLERVQRSNEQTHAAQQALQDTNSQLEYLATHDSLTGLINRREFERRLWHALTDTREGGVSHALLYLDLDQFKVVNDTGGHTAGDELLKQISGALLAALRSTDALGRLGGDEFGVLLCNTSERQAREKAQTLSRFVQEFRFRWDGKLFPVGVSIGVVPVTAAFADVIALLRAADSACYAAKDGGRNRVHVYREDDEQILRQQNEMQWLARIRQALDEGRMRLYVHRIDSANGQVRARSHYEVLLRMVDDKGAIISPEQFVPAAERYGLITALDRWVVGSVIDWLAKTDLDHLPVDMLSVNLSGPTVSDEGFRRFLCEKLQTSGVPAELLCFEITETAAINHLAKAIAFMTEMKSRGCRFALDDFGSGVSSLGYLKQLPVDMLKIDGVFIRNMLEDPIGEAMVKSIIDVAHAMGLDTIAEYVTSHALQRRLLVLGVDYVQGFGVSRPHPLEDLALRRVSGAP